MPLALLLINERASAWVSAETGPSGAWRLPEIFVTRLAARFAISPGGPRLVAAWHGDLLVLRADPALVPRRRSERSGPGCMFAPPELNGEQQQVLAMLLQGLTTRQMMRKLGRKRRCVLYRVAEVKHAYEVQTRVELVLRAIKHP